MPQTMRIITLLLILLDVGASTPCAVADGEIVPKPTPCVTIPNGTVTAVTITNNALANCLEKPTLKTHRFEATAEGKLKQLNNGNLSIDDAKATLTANLDGTLDMDSSIDFSGTLSSGETVSGTRSGELTASSNRPVVVLDSTPLSESWFRIISGQLSGCKPGIFTMDISGKLVASATGTTSIATTVKLTGPTAAELTGVLKGTLTQGPPGSVMRPPTSFTAEIKITHRVDLSSGTATIKTCLALDKEPSIDRFLSTIVVTDEKGEPISTARKKFENGCIILTATSKPGPKNLCVSYRHAAAPWKIKYVITQSTTDTATVATWAMIENPTPNDFTNARITLCDRDREEEEHAIDSLGDFPGNSIVRKMIPNESAKIHIRKLWVARLPLVPEEDSETRKKLRGESKEIAKYSANNDARECMHYLLINDAAGGRDLFSHPVELRGKDKGDKLLANGAIYTLRHNDRSAGWPFAPRWPVPGYAQLLTAKDVPPVGIKITYNITLEQTGATSPSSINTQCTRTTVFTPTAASATSLKLPILFLPSRSDGKWTLKSGNFFADESTIIDASFKMVEIRSRLKPEIEESVNLHTEKINKKKAKIADAKVKLAKLKSRLEKWNGESETDVTPAILRDLSVQIEQIEKEINVHETDQQQIEFERDQILNGRSVFLPNDSPLDNSNALTQ